MKRSSFPMKWACGALGSLTLVSFVASADAPAPAAPPPVNAQLSAYQSTEAEESVRKETDKIQGEVAELLGELKLNGLSQTDAIFLANAVSHLKSLSQDDMQKVINTLQSASMAAQEQDRQASLVSAFQGQSALTVKLKSLAAELAAQESQKELPAKLQNLIARQAANIRQTSTLPGAASPAQLNATQGSLHGVVSAEQSGIEGEIDILYQSLSATPDATPPTDGSNPDASKAVFDAMTSNALKDVASEATQLTEKGPFHGAVGEQTTVLKSLTATLRAALSKMDAVSQLQQAKTQLDQITSDQKDLAKTAQEAKLDGATLAERQAQISDRAAAAQALLNSISPAAASQLNQAQQAMQQSSDALAKAKSPADTAPQQQAVAQDLDKTAALLDQQIASAEKQENASPMDKAAELQQLQDQLAQAQQNPQLTPAELQKLQQEAADLSTPAADKIADAQDQLQQDQPDPPQQQSQQSPSDPSQQQPQQNQSNQSQQQSQQNQSSQTAQQSQQNQSSPSQQQSQQNQSSQTAQQPPSNPSDPNSPQQTGQNPSAPTAQQSQQHEADEAAADKLLAQASDDLKQQQDAMKDAAQDYQALSKESDELNQAQQQTQAADQSMNGAKPDLSDAAHDLTQAQADVDKMKQDSSSSDLPPDSKDALQQASDALKDGTMQAVQAKKGNAQADGQKAEAAMEKAQAGLQDAMAKVQEKAESEGQRQRSEMARMMKSGTPFDASHGRDEGMIAGWGGPASGPAQVIGGLKPKDRAAISEYKEEKSPPEYASAVQQYLKNLADASESH